MKSQMKPPFIWLTVSGDGVESADSSPDWPKTCDDATVVNRHPTSRLLQKRAGPAAIGWKSLRP